MLMGERGVCGKEECESEREVAIGACERTDRSWGVQQSECWLGGIHISFPSLRAHHISFCGIEGEFTVRQVCQPESTSATCSCWFC